MPSSSAVPTSSLQTSLGPAGPPAQLLDIRIGNRYKIGRKIGSGSFGDIYLGNYCVPFEECVANPLRLVDKCNAKAN